MGSGQKPRLKDHGKSTEKTNVNDIVKSITDMLWTYDKIKHVVRNNYVVLSSIVRNTVKSLGINANNFDLQSLMDNFDIHMLDLKSQDTLSYSLSELMSRFIVNKADNNVDIAMEIAPSMIESRLREVMDYLRKNPQDSETVEYANELLKQLSQFDRKLATKYGMELRAIVNPKPVEPKPVETKAEPKARVKVVSNEERERKLREIDSIVYILRIWLSATPLNDRMFPYWLEQCKMYIEKLRKLDPQLASEYERELRRRVYEKEKYSNYGKKRVRERRVRIKRASAKITDFFDAKETETENANKQWKRYVKGILKWMAVVAII